MSASGSRSRIGAALQVVVTIATLVAMVLVLASERERLASALTLGVGTLAAAAAVTLTSFVVDGVRLKAMLDLFSAGVGHLHSLGVVVGGYTLNYLPMKAGTVLQGAALKARWGVRLPHFAALSAAGQLVSLWSAVTLAGLCLAVVGGRPYVVAALVVAPSAALVALLLWSRSAAGSSTDHPKRLVRAARAAVTGLADLFAHRRVMAITVAANVAAIVLAGARIWLLMTAMGHSVSLVEAVLISALGIATHMFGLLPGGIGFREGGVVAGAALAGVDPGTALALALVDRGVDMLVVLAFGVPSALWMGRLAGAGRPTENTPGG